MAAPAFTLRRAGEDDFDRWVQLFEAVASEGRWICAEVPLDREQVHRSFVERCLGAEEPAAVFLAEAAGWVIGDLGVRMNRGVADVGMMVTAEWRGRGVGSALMQDSMEWARDAGAHKMALQVWPHNDGARRLYRRFGFVEEGRLRRHWRRRDGALWDSIVMGLVLDVEAPGSPYG